MLAPTDTADLYRLVWAVDAVYDAGRFAEIWPLSLVIADWLEEHGDPRAEKVRAVVARWHGPYPRVETMRDGSSAGGRRYELEWDARTILREVMDLCGVYPF